LDTQAPESEIKQRKKKGMPSPIAIVVDALTPAAFLAVSSGFALYTFVHLIFVERRPKRAFHYAEFKSEHFARLWTVVGPLSRRSDETRVHHIMSRAEGVVVDVGYVDSHKDLAPFLTFTHTTQQ
jgi:hypothetical protein